MLPIILPLYGAYVLNITNSTVLSLLLGIAFIAAAGFIGVWRIIVQKLGVKYSYLLAQIAFIATLLPLMFIQDEISAIIAFIFIGFGLAGAMIVRDVTLGVIIDEDELKTGVRREGAFYGVNGFFAKLTNAVIILSISLILNTVGWTVFTPSNVTPQVVFGLRCLMSLFPIIMLVIGIIGISFFPINKARDIEITAETQKLHEQKSEALAR
jgi:GPH family glycoside/pentoside/hexuronide:cation symporter